MMCNSDYLYSCLVIFVLNVDIFHVLYHEIHFSLLFYIPCLGILLAFFPFDEVKKGEKGICCFVENFRTIVIGDHELQKKGGVLMFESNFQMWFCHHQKGGD